MIDQRCLAEVYPAAESGRAEAGFQLPSCAIEPTMKMFWYSQLRSHVEWGQDLPRHRRSSQSR